MENVTSTKPWRQIERASECVCECARVLLSVMFTSPSRREHVWHLCYVTSFFFLGPVIIDCRYDVTDLIHTKIVFILYLSSPGWLDALLQCIRCYILTSRFYTLHCTRWHLFFLALWCNKWIFISMDFYWSVILQPMKLIFLLYKEPWKHWRNLGDALSSSRDPECWAALECGRFLFPRLRVHFACDVCHKAS